MLWHYISVYMKKIKLTEKTSSESYWAEKFIPPSLQQNWKIVSVVIDYGDEILRTSILFLSLADKQSIMQYSKQAM